MVTFEPIFPKTQYGSLHSNYSIITEDKGAGRQFFSRAFPDSTVIGCNGRDDIINQLHKCTEPVLVIADGAAFGFNMPAVLESVTSLCGQLIVLESFEYAILKSGVIHSKDERMLALEKPLVESRQYSSWEQYYTKLLETVSAGTPLAYKKAHLSQGYSNIANIKKILNAYALLQLYEDYEATKESTFFA